MSSSGAGGGCENLRFGPEITRQMARRKQTPAKAPAAAADRRSAPQGAGGGGVREASPPPLPAPPPVPERLWRGVLAATLLAYFVIQILYLTATPLQTITLPDNLPQGGSQDLLVGIGPDEKEHFLYILSLANRGRLPAPDPPRRRSSEEYVSYQAQHPPLFYVAAAGIYRAASGAGLPFVWYLLRALCAACGAVVIVLAARAARLAFPERPVVALATAPFVAFLPMFGHMTGNLSNEPAAMALGAWAWLQMVRMVRSDAAPTARGAALLGVTLGLAALTRLTALLWLPCAVVVLAYLAARDRPRVSLRVPLAFAGCLALCLAPWFLYSQSAYGTPFLRTFDRPLLADVSLAQYLADPAGHAPPNAVFVVTPLATALWYASTSWWPFWLLQFYLPGFPNAAMAWQALFLLLAVFAGLLLFLHASRARRERGGQGMDDGAGRALLWAAGAALGFCLLALVQQQLYSDWNVVVSAGRYTVAAVPAWALLFLFAVSTLAPHPPGAQRALAGFVAALLLIFDLFAVSLVRRFYRDNPAQPAVQRIEARGEPAG